MMPMRRPNDSASGVMCEYRSSTGPMPLIVGYRSASGRCGEHRLPPLAVARRRVVDRSPNEVDVVVHDGGAGVEARDARWR